MKRWKFLLSGVTLIALTGALAITAWAVWGDHRVTLPQARVKPATASATNLRGIRPPNLDDFAPVLELRWQRPLFDPPPPPPPAAAPKPEVPPPRVTLLATVVQGQQRQAMFQFPSGSIVFKLLGEVIVDEDRQATLIEVGADFVVLEHDEKQTRISLNGN